MASTQDQTHFTQYETHKATRLTEIQLNMFDSCL